MMKLDLSSKFVLRFLSLLYILYKKAFSTIAFFEQDDINDQKAINNFLFNPFMTEAVTM